MIFKKAFSYEITLNATINGGVVLRCGCAELTYTSTNAMLKDLREYFKDPEQVEKDYHEAMKELHGAEIERLPPATTRPPELRTLGDQQAETEAPNDRPTDEGPG